MDKIAALFVRKDSVYKTIPGVDCYDIDRDARTFPGGMPIVAHPPCRTWGKYSHRAKAPDGEHELALWAVEQVIKWGGVLEHPVGSRLEFPLLINNKRTNLYKLNQGWFGHLVLKPTLIYVVSKEPIFLVKKLMDACDDRPLKDNHLTPRYRELENLSHKQREETPIEFAEFLVSIARRCA